MVKKYSVCVNILFEIGITTVFSSLSTFCMIFLELHMEGYRDNIGYGNISIFLNFQAEEYSQVLVEKASPTQKALSC